MPPERPREKTPYSQGSSGCGPRSPKFTRLSEWPHGAPDERKKPSRDGKDFFPSTQLKAQSAPVNVFPVAHHHHQDDQFRLLDSVDDPVITDADPIELCLA